MQKFHTIHTGICVCVHVCVYVYASVRTCMCVFLRMFMYARYILLLRIKFTVGKGKSERHKKIVFKLCPLSKKKNVSFSRNNFTILTQAITYAFVRITLYVISENKRVNNEIFVWINNHNDKTYVTTEISFLIPKCIRMLLLTTTSVVV